jgi:4-carboxymuconolactone decarboxylase
VSGRRFPALHELELDGERRAVLEQLASGGRKVDLTVGLDQLRLGPFEALLLVPELASCVQAVGEHIRFSSSLPPQMRELAILVAARRWSSLFEWHIHEQVAAREVSTSRFVTLSASANRWVKKAPRKTMSLGSPASC